MPRERSGNRDVRWNRRQSRILGGVFGLESPAPPGDTTQPPFAGPNVQYFLSVRCALEALCLARGPRSAWLPSYLCGTLTVPFLRSGVAIRFYGVDQNLRVADFKWIGEVRSGDLVLAIHYFGVPDAGFPAGAVAARGALLVEDASQALFLPRQFPESTCILYSPRKFLGVPDCGILVSHGETGTESVALQEPPQAWWRFAVAMTLKRRDFDQTGRPSDWHAMFRRVEAEFPVGLYRASDLSRMLVSTAADYQTMRTRRRANQARLRRALGGHALLAEPGPDAVLCGFPVRVDPAVRDRVVGHLHEQRIYVPVHWPLEGVVPLEFRDSHTLAASCITLLCDQRCAPHDIERQAAEFQAALRGNTHRPAASGRLNKVLSQ